MLKRAMARQTPIGFKKREERKKLVKVVLGVFRNIGGDSESLRRHRWEDDPRMRKGFEDRGGEKGVDGMGRLRV